jgi:hypothetical protein
MMRQILDARGRVVLADFHSPRLSRCFADVWAALWPEQHEYLLARVAPVGAAGRLVATDRGGPDGWAGFGSLRSGPGLSVVWLGPHTLANKSAAFCKYIAAHELGHLWRGEPAAHGLSPLLLPELPELRVSLAAGPYADGYTDAERLEEDAVNALAAEWGFEQPDPWDWARNGKRTPDRGPVAR